MATVHDGLSLAFFLTGMGRREESEKWRGAEARMGPDPQGC
jgi:hypothetical protein